jgi:hypothetical protein
MAADEDPDVKVLRHNIYIIQTLNPKPETRNEDPDVKVLRYNVPLTIH